METRNQFPIRLLIIGALLGGSAAHGASAGVVVAWTGNGFSELAVPLAARNGVAAISAGSHYNLAIKDGVVIAWGDNFHGEGTVPVAAQIGVLSVATGGDHSLALKNDGSVIAWGANDRGQTTVPPAAQSEMVSIAAGDGHSVALKVDGSVVVWGETHTGQTRVPAAALSGVTAIAVGGGFDVALKNGGVIVWGGICVCGQADVPLAAQSGVVAIAAGGGHVVALKTDGSVVAWGDNHFGQAAVPVEAQSGVAAIAAGSDHSVALKSNGVVVVWGHDLFGEPFVPAAALTQVTTITAAGFYTLGLAPPIAPVFVTQPQNQTTAETLSASFSSRADALPSAVYFLEHNGNILDTNSNGGNFTLHNVTLADSGDYTIIASNYAGTTTSAVARLTVLPTGSLDRWIQRNPIPQGSELFAVTYGLNKFVAVGRNGTIINSTDGTNWNVRSIQSTSELYSVVYDQGMFMAVGEHGIILTSTNGDTWVVRELQSEWQISDEMELAGVAFGNGRFVTVGTVWSWLGPMPFILGTSNGVDLVGLTANFPPGSYYLNGVAYGSNGWVVVDAIGNAYQTDDFVQWFASTNGLYAESVRFVNDRYLAVGDSGRIASAFDGINWTQFNSGTKRLYDAAYGGNHYVSVGGKGTISHSPDAAAWSLVSSPTTDRLQGVAYGNNLFVAVGENGAILTSYDGQNWFNQRHGNVNNLDGLAVGNGFAVAVGQNGIILVSTNGSDWTQPAVPVAAAKRDWHGVGYGDGKWVVVGESTNLLTSTNGLHWELRSIGFDASDLKSVVYANGRWVAVGTGGSIITSFDAVTWTHRASLVPNDLNEVTYGNGLFVVVGDGYASPSATLLTSTDGVTWADRTYALPGKNARSVAFANGLFVVALNDGQILYGTNPVSGAWSSAFTGISDDGANLRGLTWSHGVWIVVGNNGLLLTSGDAQFWQQRVTSTSENLHAARYLNGTFIIVGNAGTILQSEPPSLPLSIGDAIVIEGNAGTTNAVFTVRLATNHTEVVSVDFTTVDGSATAGTDYLTTNGTLIFNPGETNKSVSVPVLGDVLNEADEGFTIRLSNPTNINLLQTQAAGTILDDDTVPLFVTDVTVLEGNSGTTSAVFELHLTHPHVLPVSVEFTTADGSAMAGADYISTNGTVTFAPGETGKSITALIVGDLFHEMNETFYINLSQPVNAVLVSSPGIGTIVADDTAQLYVNLGNSNPAPPYTNWATAATTIQDAIDTAIPGDEIVVTNGVYQTGGQVADGVMNRVVVNKPITVRSVNGPSATIIAGYRSGNCPFAVSSVRCVYLVDRAVLVGFTLTNGSASCYGNGGGVRCASTSAVLSNCVLTGNSAYYGAGAYSGTLNNCVLNSNGGNVFYGGGAYNSTLNNCVLTGNSSTYGGGASSSTLNNCTLSGNSASSGGGGTYSGTLNNCALNGNTSAYYGGGTFSSIVNNCTLTANSARNGGGAQDGTLNNCIVYFNIATAGANYAGGTFNYSCTTPLPFSGTGSFTNAPLFIDLANGNLRLQSDSPCINAGRNLSAPGNTDLGGDLRIVGGTVDVGAYEFQSPQSLISYAWLQQFSLPIDATTDSADPDGDRLNNFQEWRTGTDPTNALATLRMFAPVSVASDVIVSWQSVSSRSYYLERGTNLGMQPTFLLLKSNIVGQAGMTTFTDTNAVDPGPFFYRVGVQE